MSQILGLCEKKQYEHAHPHPQYHDINQWGPPFACYNWHPIPQPKKEPSVSDLLHALEEAQRLIIMWQEELVDGGRINGLAWTANKAFLTRISALLDGKEGE